MLLPWNSFITAVDFFGKVFPGAHIDRVFSVAYMTFNIVSIALNLQLQRFSSASTRVVVGLFGYVLSLLCVPMADVANRMDILGLAGYKMVLVTAVVCAAFFDGVVQPAVFGEAMELPMSCVQVSTLWCPTHA